MKRILTIVVPTYNAEKYLEDNLKSFCIPEILDDIQVLVINDGSTDGSLKIAEKYAKRYPEVYKVISKQNGGHGSGINCGIKHAEGKYFKVVDADDWIAREAFVKLVRFLKQSDSDIVYSGFYWVFDKGQAKLEDFEKEIEIVEPFSGVIYGKEYRFDDIADRSYIKMHNMTIKTNILQDNNIYIDEHCYYVDTEYITYPIPFAHTISCIDEFVYMYRIGSSGQSVSLAKMREHEKNYDKVMESLLKYHDQLGKTIECSEAKKKYISRIIARVVAGKMKIMLSFPASKEKKEQMISYDRLLLTEYPDIYSSNINKAIKLLRKTNYLFYNAAHVMVCRKYQ